MEDTNGKTFEAVKVSTNEFTREGYTFTSWNTKADGTGDSYEEGSDYTLTPETDILYAQWEENPKDTPEDNSEENSEDESDDESENQSEEQHEGESEEDSNDKSEENPEEQFIQSTSDYRVANVSDEISVTNNERGDSPKTGESTSMLPIIGIVLSLIGIAILFLTRKKKEL